MRFYRQHPDDPFACQRIELEKPEKVPSLLQAGYVPSVTTILGVIRHSFLEAWLIAESLQHFEEHGSFKAALTHRNTIAADFGTVCHALIESRLKGTPCREAHDHRHVNACEPLWSWMDANVEVVLWSEELFADGELGYGGTADLLVLMKDGRQILLDLKTKKHSPNFPLKADMACRYQLSAYRRHFQKVYGPMSIGNLFLASPLGYLPQPRLLFVDYGEADWAAGFDAARHLWLEQNGVPAQRHHATTDGLT